MSFFRITTHDSAKADNDIIRRVNFDCNLIVEFCSKYFTKLKRAGFKSIFIYLTDNFSEKETVLPPIPSVFPCVSVIMHYDFNRQFLVKNNDEKKREIIRILKEGSVRSAEFMGWDYQMLEACFDNLISETNYCFTEKLSKQKKNPNRGVSAYVKREIETDKLRYFVEIVDKKKEHNSIPVISINYLFELLPFFGQTFFIIKNDGDWISNSIYQVSNITGNIFYKIDVEKMSCDISYLSSSEEELLFLKGKIALATTNNDEEKLLLIKKWKDLIRKEVEDTLQKRFQ